MKNVKKHISTSPWSVHYPNTGQNIPHTLQSQKVSAIFLLQFWPNSSLCLTKNQSTLRSLWNLVLTSLVRTKAWKKLFLFGCLLKGFFSFTQNLRNQPTSYGQATDNTNIDATHPAVKRIVKLTCTDCTYCFLLHCSENCKNCYVKVVIIV